MGFRLKFKHPLDFERENSVFFSSVSDGGGWCFSSSEL